MPSRETTDKRIMLYYFFIAIIVVATAFAIIGKASITWFTEGSAWRALGEKQEKPNVIVPATRGDIYSADYELMATTEARYRLFRIIKRNSSNSAFSF
jgi:cell division protein FtsI (penicillin-binding protein 3)